MNVLIQDLLAASGHVMAHALNELPESTRTMVVDAIDAGAWTELRVGVRDDAASVLVMLVNSGGSAVELARVDHMHH